MRLHEALEKTETGKVRRRTWGETVISKSDSGTKFLHLVDATANDWEPVPPESDEWEEEALSAVGDNMRSPVCSGTLTPREHDMVVLAARALKEKFGRQLDVERLARDVADFLAVNGWHKYRRDTVENAICTAAKAQQEGK